MKILQLFVKFFVEIFKILRRPRASYRLVADKPDKNPTAYDKIVRDVKKFQIALNLEIFYFHK